MPKPPRHAESTEVGGVFRPGQKCPGQDGPFPGPWFTLSVKGSLYRGRYVEDGVWKTEHGARFSQLSGGPDETPRSTPEYAARRISIIHELMNGQRHYTPQEIAVGLRNHPETDPREIDILESSKDWHQANRLVRAERW